MVALAYSAVGHGGASGYLALMAFTKMPPKDASTLALCINVIVSSISFAFFQRAKFFKLSLAWPLLVGSIPAAFLGGRLVLHDSVHRWVLSAVLLYAAVTLIVKVPKPSEDEAQPKIWWLVFVGAAIGLLSGMVGVGGGIFLGPLLILLGWADAKTTAVTSALFILCNSISGLAARGPALATTVAAFWPFMAVAVVGALVGAWVGALKLSDLSLRRSLGLVLVLAVVKMVFG